MKHDLDINDCKVTNATQLSEVDVLAVREGEGRQIHIIYEMRRLTTNRQERRTYKKSLRLSIYNCGDKV